MCWPERIRFLALSKPCSAKTVPQKASASSRPTTRGTISSFFDYSIGGFHGPALPNACRDRGPHVGARRRERSGKRWQALGLVPAGLLSAGARALTPVPPAVPGEAHRST